jgi:hypothetical protein
MCEIDELSVRMDLGRSNFIHFAVFKIKSDQNNFFLTICIQMDAKIHEHVRVRQCHRAYVIEQTFAVILHGKTPVASCRLYSLRLIKEQ